MDSNKKSFNFSILFICIYAFFAVIILLWIWWPKSNKSDNVIMKYQKVNANQKAIDYYTVKIKKLLQKGDLKELYNKLNVTYISKNNLNENNFKEYFEKEGFIADYIEILSSSVNIQEKDVYIYRFLYYNGNKRMYVNIIETMPYEYTISFDQNTLPDVSNLNENYNVESSSSHVTRIDNIKYEIEKKAIRDNGITYVLKISNEGNVLAKYNFDNVTNVVAVLSDGKEAYMGSTVVSPDDDIVSPNGYLEKDLFFPISSSDQHMIKSIKIKNVRVGDNKKTVYINI